MSHFIKKISSAFFFRKILLLIFLSIAFDSFTQKGNVIDQYLYYFENDILFNDYLTEAQRENKVKQLIINLKTEDGDEKSLFLKYIYACEKATAFGDDQKVFEGLDELVWISEECDTTKKNQTTLYLSSLVQIYQILAYNSAYQLAFNFAKNGIELIERRQLYHYHLASLYYHDYGHLLMNLNQNDEAIRALEKASKMLKKSNNLLLPSTIEVNKANYYALSDNWEQAVFYQKKACSVLEEMTVLKSNKQLLSFYGDNLSQLSFYYFQKNNFDEAKKYASKAREIYIESGEYSHKCHNYLKALLKMAIQKHDAKEIQCVQLEIQKISEKYAYNKYQIYLLLSESYKQLNRPDMENKFLKNAFLEDQAKNKETISELQYINSKLLAQKVKYSQFKQSLREKNYTQKIQLIVVFISLLLILLLVLIYLFRTRNKLLESKNTIAEIEIEKKQKLLLVFASHIQLKQQTEATFLKQIKELKRNKNVNIEDVMTDLQIKIMNLLNIDRSLSSDELLDDINQKSKDKLKLKHPELTEKELQFCIYLLLNLSTKEISSLTNQTTGAVRVYKNYIKNKILNDTEIDLLSYLKQVSYSNDF